MNRNYFKIDLQLLQNDDKIEITFHKERNYFATIFLAVWTIGCFGISLITLASAIISSKHMEFSIALFIICLIPATVGFWFLRWNFHGKEIIEFGKNYVAISYFGSFRYFRFQYDISDIELIGVNVNPNLDSFDTNFSWLPIYLIVRCGNGFLKLKSGRIIHFGQNEESNVLITKITNALKK